MSKRRKAEEWQEHNKKETYVVGGGIKVRSTHNQNSAGQFPIAEKRIGARKNAIEGTNRGGQVAGRLSLLSRVLWNKKKPVQTTKQQGGTARLQPNTQKNEKRGD